MQEHVIEKKVNENRSLVRGSGGGGGGVHKRHRGGGSGGYTNSTEGG